MDLFQFPPAPSKPSLHNIRRSLALVPDSEIVKITNKAGREVRYVRLSDDEHAQALRTIRTLYDLRVPLKVLFDCETGLWGSRNQRKQTYGEVIDGLQEKCLRRHPIHKNRMGEDFAVKQLHVLNDLIELLNAAVDEENGPVFPLVMIPFEK